MAVKKKRRKSGKYTPLIWILTGAVIAFFISYTGNITKINLFQKSPPHVSTTNISPFDFLFKSKNTNVLKPVLHSSNEEQVVSGQQNITAKIFLASQTGNDINLVEKSVQISGGSSLLKQALESLISYHDESLLNMVPMNTKIRKIWIKNDTAYIDFSDDFSYNSYGIIGYKVQVYQVVYTATQFQQVKAVYFLIDGKPVEYLGGDGYIIHNPIYPFSSLPKFSM